MNNCYFIDTLTSVGIQEIVKVGGEVIRFYDCVIYRENFKLFPSRKTIEKLFNSRGKYKNGKKWFNASFSQII